MMHLEIRLWWNWHHKYDIMHNKIILQEFISGIVLLLIIFKFLKKPSLMSVIKKITESVHTWGNLWRHFNLFHTKLCCVSSNIWQLTNCIPLSWSTRLRFPPTMLSSDSLNSVNWSIVSCFVSSYSSASRSSLIQIEKLVITYTELYCIPNRPYLSHTKLMAHKLYFPIS